MNDVATIACLAGLALIGLLPRVFFQAGRLNARWWLTAAPFVVAGLALAGALAGVVRPTASAATLDVLAVLSLAAVAAGVALIRWTLHTHARPVSLWHQEDDRPDELLTRGAYARVRHPFYASFLLVLLGCALALPHPATLLALVAACVLLDRTAAREERRLLAAFGAHYTDYMRRTGRFVPRRRTASPESPSPRASSGGWARLPLLVLLLSGIAAPAAAQHEDPVDVGDGAADAIITGLIGGTIGGVTASATACRREEEEAGAIGSLAGALAGAGIAYAVRNAEVDGAVLFVSTAAIAALIGRGVSRLVGER